MFGFSPWFWKRITAISTVSSCLFVAISCANDSSLNVTKIDTKTMYVSLESDEAIPASEKMSLTGTRGFTELSNVGKSQVDIPSGLPFSLDAKLPAGWEIASWRVFPGGDETPGSGTHLDIPAAKWDQHLVLKVRRIPFLKVSVKISGKAYLNPGGGMISWFIYPPGTDPENLKDQIGWMDSYWCGTINGFEKDQPRVCESTKVSEKYPKGYPNGSVIEFRLEGRYKSPGFSYNKKMKPFVLKDHFTLTHDFTPDEETEDPVYGKKKEAAKEDK